MENKMRLKFGMKEAGSFVVGEVVRKEHDVCLRVILSTGWFWCDRDANLLHCQVHRHLARPRLIRVKGSASLMQRARCSCKELFWPWAPDPKRSLRRASQQLTIRQVGAHASKIRPTGASNT